MNTPNGKVEFIQIVGITADELEAMQMWNTLGVLNVCVNHMPYYITHLSRKSFLHDAKVNDVIQKGSEIEGSNTGFLFNNQIKWKPAPKKLFKRLPATVTIGAKQVNTIGKILQGRAVKKEPLRLVSNEATVVFSFGDQPQVMEKDDAIEIMLNEKAVKELAEQLQPFVKKFSIPSLKLIVFEIVKTDVTDSEGNIVETIG